jgi:anti-anti-sigma factor
MTYSIEQAENHALVAVDGDLDSAEVQDMRDDVEAVIVAGRPVIIDISKVEFIDSSGIGLIVHVYKSLTARKIKVVLSGASEQPLELLKATQLDRFLTFSKTLDEARSVVA